MNSAQTITTPPARTEVRAAVPLRRPSAGWYWVAAAVTVLGVVGAGGLVGRAVGSFDATEPGEYGVTVTGALGEGRVAVGGSLAPSGAGRLLAAALVIVVGLVLGIVTFARRSRARAV